MTVVFSSFLPVISGLKAVTGYILLWSILMTSIEITIIKPFTSLYIQVGGYYHTPQ